MGRPRTAWQISFSTSSRYIFSEPSDSPRSEVGLAREVKVVSLEAPRCLEQERRRVSPQTSPERHFRAQQVDTSGLKLVERQRFRGRHQTQRCVERSRLEARLGRDESAARTLCRVRCQRDGALKKRRRGSEPAARLRSTSRALEFDGDLLVRPCGRRGEMPRATIRVGHAIGRGGERQVDRAPVLRRRRPIHRRAHQRVPKRHPLADRQQPVALGSVRGHRIDPESFGGAPQQDRLPLRLGGGQQEQAPRVIGKSVEPADEALLDRSRERLSFQKPEAARQLRQG